MKLIELLRTINFGSLILIVYIEDDEDPIWTGTAFDLPWWLADHEINGPNVWGEEAIDFRSSLGEEHDNKPGFVISLKDSE